jgi:hypothetical protein
MGRVATNLHLEGASLSAPFPACSSLLPPITPVLFTWSISLSLYPRSFMFSPAFSQAFFSRP